MEFKLIPPPIGGINKRDKGAYLKDTEAISLDNMHVYQTVLKKRLGYRALGGAMDGTGMDILQFESGIGEKFLLGYTTKFIYKFNASNEWVNISPQAVIEDCENTTGWTAGTDMTVSADATIKKVGSASIKILASADKSFSTQLAYHNLAAAQNFTSSVSSYRTEDYNCIKFWVYTDNPNTAERDSLSIVLSEQLAGGKGATFEEFSPSNGSVAANTWTEVTVLRDLSAMNAVLSIGVEAATLNGYSWYVDDFRVMKQFTGDADDKWTHHTITQQTQFLDGQQRPQQCVRMVLIVLFTLMEMITLKSFISIQHISRPFSQLVYLLSTLTI
jgi:hypothetical protein